MQKRLFLAAMVAQAATAKSASGGMAVYFTHIWVHFVTLGQSAGIRFAGRWRMGFAPSGQQGLGYTELVGIRRLGSTDFLCLTV